MRYIDMHCDTLSEALARKKETAERLDGTMVDVARLKEIGAMAQFFAIFLPQSNVPEWFGLQRMPSPLELFWMQYRIYQNTLETCKRDLAPATSVVDLEKNQKEGKISAFLTIENGGAVIESLEDVQDFYQRGVRLITLTWNHPNRLGFCHSADREKMRRGLTDFGKEAVSYMQELGILVDVSHLSDGGFWDVAELSRKRGLPFVASHSNCRSLCAATRNLTDEMIRRLSECGGVIGLNFEPTFLSQEMPVSTVERMCDHIQHLMHQGGEDCVAIGTDFDGISGRLEIDTCEKMPLFFEALRRRGLSFSKLEKLAYKNAKRVIREGMRAGGIT
ncbi:MAG: dipeptidase [Roseburia sp.]